MIAQPQVRHDSCPDNEALVSLEPLVGISLDPLLKGGVHPGEEKRSTAHGASVFAVHSSDSTLYRIGKQLSSDGKQNTMPGMTTTLGAALRRQREETGLNIRKAAELLGISITYLSQLETGKVGLPSADVRRRLAQWLGVSHLDVLVMTGEITAEEVTTTGKVGTVTPDPNDARPELHALIDQVNWYGRPDRAGYIRAILEEMRNVDAHYKEIF